MKKGDHPPCGYLACRECTRKFWLWAENHTGGKGKGGRRGKVHAASFYEAAAKFIEVDNRSAPRASLVVAVG